MAPPARASTFRKPAAETFRRVLSAPVAVPSDPAARWARSGSAESPLVLPLLEGDKQAFEDGSGAGTLERNVSARLDFLASPRDSQHEVLRESDGSRSRRQWQKIWASYKRDRKKLRTLGISTRAAIGCILASCFVTVPSLYDRFPSGVQGMLCNAVVMVTFGVGDTLGQTVSWCISGSIGILVAFANFRIMMFATSGLLPHFAALRQAIIVLEFFLYTALVNASGTSYMARQMSMGYYAFYGLCLLNPGCNLKLAEFADLWTLVGALIAVLVMLCPPTPSAVRRVYRTDGGTLTRIAKAIARATTLTTTVFLAVEDHALLIGGGEGGTSDNGADPNNFAATFTVIQDALDGIRQLLAELEKDLKFFWWEAAMASSAMVRRYDSMVRTAEGFLLMQRQGILFNHSNDRGEGMNPKFLSTLREELSTINIRGMRLLGIAVGLMQHHHEAGSIDAEFDGPLTAPAAAVQEARELIAELSAQMANMRVMVAQRNLSSLPDLGTGRILFITGIARQCTEILVFATWICDEVEKDELCDPARHRRLAKSAWRWLVFLVDLLKEWVHSTALHVKQCLDPRGKPWVYSFKAATALTCSFVTSAWWFNYDSMSVSATAYILGAQGQDARFLGGTVWKAMCRIIGVMAGGILPALIHNFFVPESGLQQDCSQEGRIVNSLGSFFWCFFGVHMYKLNSMVTTEYGHFGYVGLVMAFVAAEQFLSGCQNRVPVSDFVLQTVGGSIWLLLIECTIQPSPACLSIQGKISSLLDRQAELLAGSSGGELAGMSPSEEAASPVLAVRSGEGWAAEIQWLAGTVDLVRSGVNQAMTEDTFKIGHLFFLWMPPGYSCEPLRSELCLEVLSLVQRMHLSVLFLLFAREVDSMLQRSSPEAAGASADGEDAAEEGRGSGGARAAAEPGGRSPLHWHRDLQKDMNDMIALLKDAMSDVKDLVEHGLLNDWQVRDLSIEVTAGLLLQQAARPAEGSGQVDERNMRGIFQSVLEHVDPALSEADINEHWSAFEAVMQNHCDEELVSPAFFQEAIGGVLHNLSGRPSLSLSRLDALLRYPNRLLRHGDEKPRKVELPELRGKADASDPATQRSALEICYQMALLDAVLLLAFNARQLCERLGHYPAPTTKEDGEEEEGNGCMSQ